MCLSEDTLHVSIYSVICLYRSETGLVHCKRALTDIIFSLIRIILKQIMKYTD